MPTSRVLIPALFADAQLHRELSERAVLVYIGLWLFSDDQGVYPSSLAQLRGDTARFRDYSDDDMQEIVDEMLACKRLVEFGDSRKRYLWGPRIWKQQTRKSEWTILYPLVPPSVVLQTSGVEEGLEFYEFLTRRVKKNERALVKIVANFEAFKRLVHEVPAVTVITEVPPVQDVEEDTGPMPDKMTPVRRMEQWVGRQLNSDQIREINSWFTQHKCKPEWLEIALRIAEDRAREAGDAGKRSVGYVGGIMRRFGAEGGPQGERGMRVAVEVEEAPILARFRRKQEGQA